MFHEAVEEPADRTVEAVRGAYAAELREAIETVGVERAAAETGVDEATLERLRDGSETPDLTLDEAATVLALRDDVRDAATVVAEVRDELVMAMTTAVLDVDTIATNVDLGLTGQEIQRRIEGRAPLTLGELAAIHRFVAARNER